MTLHPTTVPSRMFQDPPVQFADAYWRRCHRVMRMLAVLHSKGFHGLRVFPYNYPLAYRIEIFPGRYAASDGVSYRIEDLPGGHDTRLVARHSSENKTEYFGWPDATTADAQALAITFIERFPELCREAYYLDYAYAGWFATLLGHCDYGYLPYLFGEYEEEIGALRLHQISATEMTTFPLPPSSSYGHKLSHPLFDGR